MVGSDTYLMIDRMVNEINDANEMETVLKKVIADFRAKFGEKLASNSDWWRCETEKPTEWFENATKMEGMARMKGGWIIKCTSNITRIALHRACQQTGWRRENKAYIHNPKKEMKMAKEVMMYFNRGELEEEELAQLIQDSGKAEVYAVRIYRRADGTSMRMAAVTVSVTIETMNWEKQKMIKTEHEVIRIEGKRTEMKCFKCLRYGHTKKECQETHVRCEKCGKADGRTKKTCKNKEQKTSGYCGEEEHEKKKCAMMKEDKQQMNKRKAIYTVSIQHQLPREKSKSQKNPKTICAQTRADR